MLSKTSITGNTGRTPAVRQRQKPKAAPARSTATNTKSEPELRQQRRNSATKATTTKKTTKKRTTKKSQSPTLDGTIFNNGSNYFIFRVNRERTLFRLIRGPKHVYLTEAQAQAEADKLDFRAVIGRHHYFYAVLDRDSAVYLWMTEDVR